jgi:hypothetical protein
MASKRSKRRSPRKSNRRTKRRSPRKSRSKRRSPRKSNRRTKRRSPRKSRSKSGRKSSRKGSKRRSPRKSSRKGSKRRSPRKSSRKSGRTTGILTLKVIPKEGHKLSLHKYPGLKIVEKDEVGDYNVFKFKGSASDISLQYLNLSADMHMKKKNRKIKKYTLSKRFN